MFVELNELVKDNATFKDGSKLLVKGKDNILFHEKDNSHQLISNVYYVPNMKNNVVSLGQLLKKGYDIHLKDNSLFFKRGQRKPNYKGEISKNIMFSLSIHNDLVMYLNACHKDPTWI